jgi:hypothetical protein
MAIKGDWSDHDNKRYTGKLDRQSVSRTEGYEVEYFIDHYLETHGFAINNSNRDVATRALEDYPGRAPIQRGALTKFLETRIVKA